MTPPIGSWLRARTPCGIRAAAAPAIAAGHKLRVQTHFPAESTPREIIARFIDDVTTMSDGTLEINTPFRR